MGNKGKNNTNILVSIFIIKLSIFLVLSLTYTTPFQITISLSVFASSSNSENQSNPEDYTDVDNSPLEVDEGLEQQPSEISNYLNDSSPNDNNPDTNIGLFDSGSIDKNILKGKDVSSPSIETAYLTVSTFNGQEIVDYFGYQLRDELGETVSVCVETVAEGGTTVLAIPHCFTKGFNHTELLAVKPGQILMDIKYSPRLIVDDSSHCSIDYLVPKQSEECMLAFLPAQIGGDITPKPDSDFGKSMLGP